jgi:DNA mismatch endonuclease (patch repair protein)
MQAIKSRDTRPEMIVRRLVHSLGYRYGLHRKDLPGHPDLVLRKHRKVIFVHGCFWHTHACKYGRVRPATNEDFWEKKRLGNAERDRRNLKTLKNMQWGVLIIWECWTRDMPSLERRLRHFLET